MRRRHSNLEIWYNSTVMAEIDNFDIVVMFKVA